MEQATNAAQLAPANAPKAPGQMAALSAQAIGRGADGILFFQWRQSRAGSEKFHSAMLPHAGTETRTWREVVDLGARLAALPELPAGGARRPRRARLRLGELVGGRGARPPAERSTTSRSSQRWYGRCTAGTCRSTSSRPSASTGGYDLVIAPLLYLLRDEGAAALTSFVEGGGHLLAGPFTDIVDEHDRFRARRVPDPARPRARRALRGLRRARRARRRARRSRASARRGSPAEHRRVGRHARRRGDRGDGCLGRGLVHERAPRGASGAHRAHGRAGAARYLATIPDEAGTQAVVDHVLRAAGIAPVVAGLPEHVEAARRGNS